MLTLATITLALFASAFGQTFTNLTTETELEYVTAQYNASGLNEPLPNSQSFMVPLNAMALLHVQYGQEAVQNGQDLTAEATSALPQITVVPTEQTENLFNSSAMFTLVLADASAVGGPDPEGDFRHFLANNVTVGNNGTLDLEAATVITSYAGPGPLENSGIHRYAWLLFQQTDAFSAPEGLSSANTPPSHWSVQEYQSQANLGNVMAASFFTVTAPGTASFSGEATSSVASPTAAPASTISGGSSIGSAAPSQGANAAVPTSAANNLQLGSAALGLLTGLFALIAIA